MQCFRALRRFLLLKSSDSELKCSKTQVQGRPQLGIKSCPKVDLNNIDFVFNLGNAYSVRAWLGVLQSLHCIGFISQKKIFSNFKLLQMKLSLTEM